MRDNAGSRKSDVGVGSKPEILEASKSCPLFLQSRHFNGTDSRCTRVAQIKKIQHLDRWNVDRDGPGEKCSLQMYRRLPWNRVLSSHTRAAGIATSARNTGVFGRRIATRTEYGYDLKGEHTRRLTWPRTLLDGLAIPRLPRCGDRSLSRTSSFGATYMQSGRSRTARAASNLLI